MRRKTIALLFAMLMLLGTAFADEFEFRNGIHFGDSPEIVKEKETLEFKSDYEKGTLVFGKGTIATIQDTDVYYYFTDNKLSDVLYYMGTCYSDGEKCAEGFATVYQGLCRKYGDPLGDIEKILRIFEGKAVGNANGNIKYYENLGGSGDIVKQYVWVAPFDDYYVKIDQVIYYGISPYTNSALYYHLLSYRQFTGADIDRIITLLEEMQKKVDSDL